MKKVLKSFKPFIGVTLVAIALLFVQAFSDLKLPNYMSSIVNVGIQQSGIEHASPESFNEDGYRFIASLLPDTQKNEFQDAYHLDSGVYKIDTSLDRKEVDLLVSDAITTLMLLDIEGQGGQGSIEVDVNIKDLYAATPLFEMMDKTEAYEKAQMKEETVRLQTGVMVAKLLYEDQGISTSSMQTNYIIKTGASMLAITLLGALAAISVSYVSAKIGAGFSRRLRNEIFSKVESFSSVEFNEFSSSSLVIRTTNDVTQVQQMVVMGIRMFFYAPIMALGGIYYINQTETSLTWIIVVACSIIAVLFLFVALVAVPKFKIVQKYVDRLTLVFRENLNGVMVIRAFGNKKFENERFDKSNTDSANLSRFINRIMSSMMPLLMFVMNLTTIAILWFGAEQVSAATMQVGDMMAFMQYTMQIIMSFLMIAMMFIFVPRAIVSLNRITEILDRDNVIVDPENPQNFNPEEIGLVEFNNVSFKYDGADEYILKDINFTAKPSQTTAIIGSTGSGKSTLVNLIPRFYDVSEGSIKVNGVDVREVKQFDLRESIGFIPQKGILLSGDVESNLKYGRPDADQDDLNTALSISQSNFILNTEEGLESFVAQGGTNFSGGQRQRLSIARALVKEAPIIVFDDSFSALDFKTDQNLRHAIKEQLSQATLIIVAQRVNTIIDADQIIVLDQGLVVGQGTHRELLKTCPTYYDIASSQLSQEELDYETK
ncbi:MAG TPA: ABC transporter ATP-binding protein [Erysipelothrix sp.]|nr:ABC transporter ATP-binding protein [Erysipelothrix sp.]